MVLKTQLEISNFNGLSCKSHSLTWDYRILTRPKREQVKLEFFSSLNTESLI